MLGTAVTNDPSAKHTPSTFYRMHWLRSVSVIQDEMGGRGGEEDLCSSFSIVKIPFPRSGSA